MPIPDRDQQIIRAHAAFICQAVEFLHDADGRAQLDALLKAAASNGWNALADAVRAIADGRRDVAPLGTLDDEDRVIALAILRGLQDPATLPDPRQQADPTLAAPGIHVRTQPVRIAFAVDQRTHHRGHMTHAATDLAHLFGHLTDQRQRPYVAAPGGVDHVRQSRGRQLILQILEELGKLDLH